MSRLTPALLDEYRQFNAAQKQARDAYNHRNDDYPDCSTGGCTTEMCCWKCRARARADLKVATSVAECAELLEVLDRPWVKRGRPIEAIHHGTEGGYKAHRRRGENACPPCLTAANKADRDRRKKK